MQSLRVVSKQFAKYLAVGGLSNSLAYGLYIAITLAGVNPIASMSIVYVVASVAAFAANRGWTFQSDTSLSRSALRYVVSQVLGYGTNLFLLSWLYSVLGVPHQVAQLIGISFVAVELFLLNRYYVFS
jgi:putative flippase GtrA